MASTQISCYGLSSYEDISIFGFFDEKSLIYRNY